MWGIPVEGWPAVGFQSPSRVGGCLHVNHPEQGEGGVYPSARVAKQGVHTGDEGCGSERLVSVQGE